jgi:hypothetical protein
MNSASTSEVIGSLSVKHIFHKMSYIPYQRGIQYSAKHGNMIFREGVMYRKKTPKMWIHKQLEP